MPVRDKPEVIYDGSCEFCSCWATRWKRLTGDRIKYIPASNAQDSVQLLEMNGNSYNGAEAVFRILAYAPRLRVFLWMYRHVPWFAPFAEWFYRRIATRRGTLSHLNR